MSAAHDMDYVTCVVLTEKHNFCKKYECIIVHNNNNLRLTSHRYETHESLEAE